MSIFFSNPVIRTPEDLEAFEKKVMSEGPDKITMQEFTAEMASKKTNSVFEQHKNVFCVIYVWPKGLLSDKDSLVDRFFTSKKEAKECKLNLERLFGHEKPQLLSEFFLLKRGLQVIYRHFVSE